MRDFAIDSPQELQEKLIKYQQTLKEETALINSGFVMPLGLIMVFETIQSVWFVIVDIRNSLFSVLAVDFCIFLFNLLGLFLLLMPMANLTSHAKRYVYELETALCFHEHPATTRFFMWVKDSELGWEINGLSINRMVLLRVGYIAVALNFAIFSYFIS